MSSSSGAATRRPRDLRAGLASLYAGSPPPAAQPEPAAPAREVGTTGAVGPGVGGLGGAPGVLIEQQKRGLLTENAELKAELGRLREEGDADVLLDSVAVRDRYPPDRTRHAFEDEAFQSLKRSIAENGQDQPILVRPHPTEAGVHEIAYGRRRREACRQLGLKVRARVRRLTDEELLRAMIRENREREALSLYERAAFARRLAEGEGLSVRRLAAALGISPGYASRLLRLPVLPCAIEDLVGDPRPLSVRALEELATALGGEGTVERVLEGWGAIKPAATPERRARQVIALARITGAAAPGSAEPNPGLIQERPLATASGRPLGRLVRRADGARVIELARGLREEEVETLLAALERALERVGVFNC